MLCFSQDSNPQTKIRIRLYTKLKKKYMNIKTKLLVKEDSIGGENNQIFIDKLRTRLILRRKKYQ